MNRIKIPFTLVIIILFISGCSSNIPPLNNPNLINSKEITFFIDQNGNFYPDNWKNDYEEISSKKGLLLIAKEKNKVNDLLEFENNLLGKFENKIRNKKRIFILVHGYKVKYEESSKNYNLLKNKINLNEDDAVVNFYWDGFSATGWFSATGSSQLAGENGLRKILNQIYNKKVFLISHSRGASVILSSLSNPPYRKGFKEQIKKLSIEINPKEIKENNNIIRLILLAPAVGYIDFRKPNYYNNIDTISFRKLGVQLKSIDYTHNTRDDILKKFFNFFSNKFNPTDLGYNIDVGKNLEEYYKMKIKFNEHNLSSVDGHSFHKYIKKFNFNNVIDKYEEKK